VAQIPAFARRRGFDLLIVIGALESGLEAALHQDAVLSPGTPAWVVVLTVPFVVLPLLARRRFPFAAPLAVWVMAVGLSFIDGNVVTGLGVLFAAGMAAAFLLGNVQNTAHGRIGLVVTLASASGIAYNDPHHAPGEFLVTPGLFAIAWLAGFAVRERSAQAASSEERALAAERKREENARQAVFAERVRIARELHDVVAHHVSVMGVQAGAARVVIDRDPRKAKDVLAAIEASSRQAVAELHRLLGFLRQDGDEDGLAPQPGVDQLPRLVASMSDTQLGVEITVGPPPTRMSRPPAASRTVLSASAGDASRKWNVVPPSISIDGRR